MNRPIPPTKPDFDYKELSRYCDQLQLEKKELANLVGQYAKLSQDSSEIEFITDRDKMLNESLKDIDFS